MAPAATADVGTVTLLNKGQRHFDLGYEQLVGEDGKPQFYEDGKPIPDKDKPRKYAPNNTITLPAKEGAKLAAKYPKELVDLSKIPGAVDVGALKGEAAKLKAENEALKAQLAALPKVEVAVVPVVEAPVQAPVQSQGNQNKGYKK